MIKKLTPIFNKIDIFQALLDGRIIRYKIKESVFKTNRYCWLHNNILYRSYNTPHDAIVTSIDNLFKASNVYVIDVSEAPKQIKKKYTQTKQL